jgi:HAD superfamily hydrolase (TIGR01450 family)
VSIDPQAAPLAPTTAPGLLATCDALLLDLDGVVYVGPDPVPHAVEALLAARAAGVSTAYVTNNAARPPAAVAEHLRSFGLPVAPDDVVTSAQAGAREVAARVPAGSRVLVVGGPGVADAVTARGLVPVRDADERPAAVLMGYGPDVSWRDLAQASYAVGGGAVFVATNADLTIPTPQGIAPGNGALVATVVTATGRAPVVAGKPFEPLMAESVDRVRASRPLIVGDRLDTDVEAGHRTGIPSLLVLTGVTTVATLLSAPAHQRPTYLAADLRGLLRPAARLTSGAPGAALVGDGLDRLREACVRSWDAADAGRSAEVDALGHDDLVADVAAALAG